MSTVIVKENETLDSAIRRWKKKCANDGIIGEYHRRSPPQGGLREAQRSPQEESGSRAQTLLQIIPSEPTKRRPTDVVFFVADICRAIAFDVIAALLPVFVERERLPNAR